MNLDALIIAVDNGLRTVLTAAQTVRRLPGQELPEAELSEREKTHAARLMRINHVGEVCAQALYQGQALTSRNQAVKATLAVAAQEEVEHLAWCESRIGALGGRKSLLNPVWYGSSLAIGMVAGSLGDKWNLGFLAETERQVGAHLAQHLIELPESDVRSRAVVAQMQTDEARHSDVALASGGGLLPPPVQGLMRMMSKVMTKTAYWV